MSESESPTPLILFKTLKNTELGACSVSVNEDGSAGETMVFAEGWLDDNGEYLGRPVDVAQLRDGSILVSDDLAGALYRISYEN